MAPSLYADIFCRGWQSVTPTPYRTPQETSEYFQHAYAQALIFLRGDKDSAAAYNDGVLAAKAEKSL